MKMEYDSFGRLIKGWLPQNEKRNSYTTADVYLVYDAQGNCTYRKENEGVETDYVYTKAGLLKEQTTDKYRTSYEYNASGKVTKVTNPDGTWTASAYDKAGHLLYETIIGNTAAVQYSYDKNGNVKTVTDRNENVTEYEYDVMNRMTKENAAGLTERSIEYDGLGRVKSETDGENNTHIYEYDALGRIVKETVNTKPQTVLNYEYDARGNVIKFTDAAGTVFKRTYTKTDLISEEKVYVKENGNEVLKKTRTYSYDEGGALKSVSDGDNTVYYNGADSEYQPDAYGKTRKEKWSRTGFEMSYDYDSLNRLTSVTTPDNKTETYTYNKNSQVSAIDGLIKGTLSYNKSRLEAVSLNNGLKKTFSYNEAGLISEISYSSDKNAAFKTGFEYVYDNNFNITDRIHKDTEEKDTFTYDGLNRLVKSNLKGKFSNDTYEQFYLFNMKEIDRDIDGMASETKATLNGQLFPADKVTLDEKGKSFVYDFKEEKEIQKIELFKTNLEKTSRIRERDLHIYTKQNEADGWSELTPDNWNYVVDPENQSIHFNLKTSLKTRFIKIRTIWDDRDLDNNNVSDYVTFTNDSVQKMIRIWTLENKRNEEYDYDRNSNRKIITENGKNRSYTYYKNDKNGNTARVMFDGKWWYSYDANGNRTARARTATRNENTVTIDKNGEYWEYTWDYHNRLIKVEQYNAPDNAQNVVVEYEYDALNRRIERTSRTKENEEGAQVVQYAYGRNGAITYQKKENSGVSRTFAYLNNQIVGFKDNSDDDTEKLYYTVTDIQGSVTEVYDEEGFLVWKSGYTAFGIKAGETTNLIDFDGLYTGCDYDAETGLTYHWNRWRSEDGSFWLSEDPARDGLNWYGYAGQNPTNYIDRNGLKKDKSGGSKGNKNNQAAPDEDPHITGPGSQDKQAPEYKGKTDNEIDQNIGNDNDGANKIFRGIQKLIVGLHLTKIGISSAQFFMSISAVLVADDGTGVGFIDDGLLAATVIGVVNSEIVAVEGALIAGDGLADVIGGAKEISKNKSKSKQGAEAKPAAEPSALPKEGAESGKPKPESQTPEGAGRRGALREAKRKNRIPTSQPPEEQIPNYDKRGNKQPGRQYKYRDSEGKTVNIRDDAGGHEYPDDPSQNRGPHFNDPSGNHYDY